MSELFLGAMTFADGFAHGTDRGEAQRIVGAYAEAGGNLIDTAVNYRDGASVQIVGEVLAGRRDRFVLCTKYGVSRDRADPNAAGAHRKNLRLSLETNPARAYHPIPARSRLASCISDSRPERPIFAGLGVTARKTACDRF